MKVHILGKDRVLNHFRLKLDQIIYSLHGLLLFLEETIAGNGKIELFGLGNLDVLDWHVVWQAKGFARQNRTCTVPALKQATAYVFRVDDLVYTDPGIFEGRLHQLVRKGYLHLQDNIIHVTTKGQVVDIWCSYTIKTLSIDTPPI